MTDIIIQLYNDKQVAALLGFSLSWVRQQRFKRRHGKRHTLDIDPIRLGASTRYLRADIDRFVQNIITSPDRCVMATNPQ